MSWADRGAPLIGIDNSELHTLEVGMSDGPSLAGQARRAGYRGRPIAESGYRSAPGLARLVGLVEAVLVGNGPIGAGDPGAAVRAPVAR